MARLPRLEWPGQAHYLIQRAHSALADQGVFTDALDRASFIAALREAGAAANVLVHAYALLGNELQLLATPGGAGALGRMVQALGRRYVSAYNRRHQRRGTLWDGRFRCAVIEPGPLLLAAMRLVDGQSVEPGVTSAGHRTGVGREAVLSDPPEFWALGNTPFEREATYRSLLEGGLPVAQAVALRNAAMGGWAAGTQAFLAAVAATTVRPAQPRPRGRPRLAR